MSTALASRVRLVRLALLCTVLPALASFPPPFEEFSGVNAAYSLDMGPRGPGAGRSSEYVAFIAADLSSLDACAAAASAWRNASAPAARCRSATYYRAPVNASFARMCYCVPSLKWTPLPSSGADSARLLWPCTDDSECSFNGECSADGACRCDAAWAGPSCAQLRLLPADASAPGLRLTDARGANVSTWGAPMLFDSATEMWHAWASEMEAGCGINSWTTNSHIIHATSLQPGGPWTRHEEVVAAFAHEPDVVRGPAGELVMIYAGFVLPNTSADRCMDCANGVTLSQDVKNGCGPGRTHAFKTLMTIARGFDEPWSAPVEIRGLSMPWDWNTCLTILPNGTAIALLRALFPWRASNYSDNTTWHAVGAPSDGGQGPSLPDSDVEDPDVWRDRRGVFHALMHAMDAGVEFCGNHAFSLDGATWVNTGAAYGNNVSFSDGSFHAFSRRERPHLLFAEDGVTPIALSTGVQYAVPQGVRCSISGAATLCDPVMSLVQPIATA